ncbi:MAG: hypothetical protein K6G50_06770 [bacterium]|nr:hypothetical protein [bacterium]
MARSQTKIAGKAISLLLAFIVFSALVTSGCGGDGGSTLKGNVMAAPTTAKVNIIHKIVSRTLNSKVASLEISAFDGKGVPQMDPYVTAKRSEISLDVPVTSKSMRIVYLDSSNKPVGIYVKPVQLKVKEEYTIEDPAWEDADSQTCFTGIRLTPDAAKVKVGEMVRLDAFGQFEAEGATFEQSITAAAEWEAYNDKYVTNKQKGLFVGASVGETKVSAYYFNQIATSNITVFGADSEDFFVEKNLDRAIEIPLGYKLKDGVEPKLRLSDGSVDNAFKHPETNYSVEDDSIIEVVEDVNEQTHEIRGLIVYPRALGETTLTLTHTEEGKEFADIVITYKVSDETLKYIMAQPETDEVILGHTYMPAVIGVFNENCNWDVAHLCKDFISSDESVLEPQYDRERGEFIGFKSVSVGTATVTIIPPSGIQYMDEEGTAYDEWSILVTVKPAIIEYIEGSHSINQGPFSDVDEDTMTVDQTIEFQVIAVWSDDTDDNPHKTDVTNECTYTSTKPAVLEFSSVTPNKATALTPGVSVVNCIYGSAFEPIKFVITVEQ